MNTLRENLKTLSEAIGVSGDEGEVRQLIREQIKDAVSTITVDPMGNLIAKINGTGTSPLKVLLTAHMDETGFMVSQGGSMLNVMEVGRLDMRYLGAARVQVGKEKLPGVLLFAPIHKSHGQNTLPHADALAVDIGAKVGDRIALMGNYRELGTDVVRGKALRGRSGCVALIEVIRHLADTPPPFEVHCAFTAQAMIYARGASVAAQRIQPDFAITLYGAECNDLPRTALQDDTQAIRMGGGVALRLVDVMLVADRRATALVLNAARNAHIPTQVDAMVVTRTDGSTVSTAHGGVPTALLGIPIRYMESPNAMLKISDVEQTIRLVMESLNRLTPEALKA